MNALSRWAGRVVLALIAAILVMNARYVARHFDEIRLVTTPTGSSAPDFSLPLLDGSTFKLADTRGQPVVLAFWASWCDPCREELPKLDTLAKTLGPTARIVAVNVEPPEMRGEAEKFVKLMHLTLPVAYGGGEVADRYHVESIPHVVVLDANGRVHEVLNGSHGPAEVKAAIDAARAAK